MKTSFKETLMQDIAHIALITICHLMAGAICILSKIIGHELKFIEALVFIAISLACRNQVKRLWNERD